MSKLLHFTLATLFLAFWIKHCAAVSSTRTWAGTKYIFFNGTINGTVNYPSPCSSNSNSYGPYPLAYLFVGVNPPWDSNPFYFELYHFASAAGLWTYDKIYNLDFQSAIYACYTSTGSKCWGFTSDPQFRVEEKLDLSKAIVSAGKVRGETGYTVTGNSQSYIGKSTDGYHNSVDVSSSCGSLGLSWNDLIWNDTISWNYTLSFSNTTASMSLLTTVKESTLNLTFSGQRPPSYRSEELDAFSDPMSNKSIELDTSDASKPQFRYSDGSNFHFHNSSGFWQVTTATTTGSAATAKATTSSTSGASAAGLRPQIFACVDSLWSVVIRTLGVGLMAAFLA